ncbi:MAG: polysaccharide biosynthesis/export family protein [Phreatobacter sp.]|uniref:polysaccharide biosynthesis/export family protein n=1 Tax=Phreatobacter sp. TaxID=1966341 RepID=UPI002732B57C|nr:polysaccharide biosynthesis/export family protein [Phreatobacter sp.]MDP2802086.1 polysaccharide biosynthesis/export family protein [Phreatobacter sp.]
MRSILLVAATALVLAGCAGRPGAGPGTLVDTTRGTVGPVGPEGALVPHEQIMPRGPYLLDTGDRLRVVVFGQEGLTNSYAVDATGSIAMPLIGLVPAAGRSTDMLTRDIAAKLRGGFIREPSVSVEVETYRPFFIMGEVTAGGQFPFVTGMTAQNAIAIAGGFTPRANRGNIEVTRKVNGQLYRADVPLTHLLAPGDTVVVRERWF